MHIKVNKSKKNNFKYMGGCVDMCRLFANTMLVYIVYIVGILGFGNQSLTYADKWLQQETRQGV